MLPVVTTYKTLLFEINISIIMHDKGNVPDAPLSVKIISPGGMQEIFPLVNDMSELRVETIYDFKFNFSTNKPDWYKLEIGTFEILPNNQHPKHDIVYDMKNIRI